MRSNWLAERAPTFFAIVAEGAWLTVFYLAVQGAMGVGEHPLGLVVLAGTVAIGMVLARRMEDRRWRTVVLGGAVLVAALVGVLISETARSQWSGGSIAVIGTHIGGLVLGLAVIRGYSHRDIGDAEAVLERLLRFGTLGLVVPWAIGLSFGEPRRDEFITAAFSGTVIFAGAALVALAGARLRALVDEAGFDWRSGRAWFGTVTVVIVALSLVMVPSAFILGAPVSVAIRELIAPAIILVWSIPVAAGSVVAALLAPLFALISPVITDIMSRLSGALGQNQPTADPTSGATQPGMNWIPIVVLIAVSVVIALVLRRVARRRKRPRVAGLDDPSDRRSIVIPFSLPHDFMPRFHLPNLHRPPRDAVTAYLRTLDEMAPHGDLARHPEETPQDHAARLRRARRAGLALDLLAADYALARFADAPLTPAEHRRAVDRWRRLRGLLP